MIIYLYNLKYVYFLHTETPLVLWTDVGREQNWIFLLVFAGHIYPRLAGSFDNTSCRSSFLLCYRWLCASCPAEPHMLWADSTGAPASQAQRGQQAAVENGVVLGKCWHMAAAHPLGSLWLLPTVCLHRGTGAQVSSQWSNSTHCNGGSVGLFSCAAWTHFYFHCDSFYTEKLTLLLTKPLYYCIALQKKSRNTTIVCKCLYLWWMYY